MPLTLTFTNAGLARFTAAQLGNGADLRVSAIGLTDSAIVVAPTLTALPGEFRRVATVSGAQVGGNIVHLIVRDDEAVTYAFRAFALYLSDGTLFAVYGQADRIMQKAAGASNMLAVDIAFPAANIATVSFGDTNFLNPPATSTTKGARYLGEVASCTLPKLTRKLEDWRGGGMDSAVKIDMGGNAMEMEWALGGPMEDVLRKYADTDIAGVQLRFTGAWQKDDSGDVDRIEVVIRGRHEEIDMGEAKPGEGGEFKVKTALSYYKLTWNGVTLIEADPVNGVLIVGGVDRRAAIRNALDF